MHVVSLCRYRFFFIAQTLCWSHFGQMSMISTSVSTPCFQFLAKTMAVDTGFDISSNSADFVMCCHCRPIKLVVTFTTYQTESGLHMGSPIPIHISILSLGLVFICHSQTIAWLPAFGKTFGLGYLYTSRAFSFICCVKSIWQDVCENPEDIGRLHYCWLNADIGCVPFSQLPCTPHTQILILNYDRSIHG